MQELYDEKYRFERLLKANGPENSVIIARWRKQQIWQIEKRLNYIKRFKKQS